MIILRATRQTPQDWDELEEMITRLFKDEIYLPILKIANIPRDTIQNSRMSALLQALQSGRITFYRGTFSGSLNSEITKELRKLGAKYDRLTRSYKIPLSDLPVDVKSAVRASDFAFEKKLIEIDQKLAKVVPAQVADKLKVEKLFDRKLWRLDKDIKETMKNITVAPQLSDEARLNLAFEWQDNMRLPIKGFVEDQVNELRNKIQSAYFAGKRYESLIADIQHSYGVSLNKAKFLARNETTLLASKFKEVRYRDSGIHEYKWQAVKGTSKTPDSPSARKAF